MADDMRLGIDVDTDTRATRREFSDLRRTIKAEAEGMAGDWEGAAEKVEDALREAGARTDLIDAARRIGQEGPSEIEKMRDALRDLDDEDPKIEIDADLDKPLTAVQDLGNEIRASIGETMGEVAGSFADNGFNMEDAIDGVIEVAAEAAQALPGPFALAGTAIVTTAAGFYGEWKKRLEQIAEDASAMYEDLTESGESFLSNEFFQTQLHEFFNPMGESYDANIKKIKLLEDLGIPSEQAALAMVGYGDDTEAVLARVNAAIERNSEIRIDSERKYSTEQQRTAAEATLAYDEIRKALEDTQQSTQTARDATDRYRDSLDALPEKVETDVDVSDNGSIRNTQHAINRVRGRNVPVWVYADPYSINQLYNTVAGLRLPAKVVQVRYGQAAV